MATWSEQHAPRPGDLIYIRDDETGEVFTGQAWVVMDNEGAVPAAQLADSMPWKTYWSVWLQCDGRCRTDNCTGVPNENNCHLLSAGDFVHVSRLPEFEVQR